MPCTGETTWLMGDFINQAFNPNGGTLAQQNWKAIAGVVAVEAGLGKRSKLI